MSMRPYSKTPQQLQEKIRKISELDKFELNPKTLYQNIYNSTGTYSKLAEIFEVPIELVQEIKELSK